MSTYTILSPVQHDGTRYEIGGTIELPEDAASLLLTAGAIEGPLAEPEAAPEPAKKR